jgi:hypothetical protein
MVKKAGTNRAKVLKPTMASCGMHGDEREIQGGLGRL